MSLILTFFSHFFLKKISLIIDTIGTVDDLIEKKQEVINKLIEYSTLLYHKYSSFGGNHICLGDHCNLKTGKLDANASDDNGIYPFFTCGHEPLKISTYAFDCDAIIISGNGEIEVKYYEGKFNAYQRTYVLEPSKYFYLFLKQCEASINDLRANSQGSVIKFITKGMLEKISIPVNELSSKYNEKIKKIYNLISKINEEIEKLKQDKKNLLSKYF